jgi:hypothetical protein
VCTARSVLDVRHRRSRAPVSQVLDISSAR